MVDTKRIVRNFFYLLGGRTFSKIVSFFLAIYIANKLGDVGLGQYSFIFSVVSLLFVIADFGVNTHLFKRWSRDKRHIADEYNLAFTLRFLLCCILFVIFAFYSLTVKEIFWPMIIAGLATFLDMFRGFYGIYFSSYEKMGYMSFFDSLERLLTVCLSALALFFGYGLIGIMTAFLLSHIIIFVLGLVLVKVRFRPIIDMRGYKDLLRVSYPFLFITIFQIIYFRIDSVMLKYMVGYQTVGWYNAAYNIVNALNFVPYLFIIVLFPSFAKLSVKDAGKRLTPLFNKTFQYLAMLAIPATVGIIVLSGKIIRTFYSAAFEPSIVALQILIIAEMFVFVNYLFGYLLNASGREMIFVKTTGGLALFNIAFNFVLIPYLSYKGAAIATVATELLNFIILYKVTKMDVSFRFLWKPIVASAVMAGGLLLLPQMHLALLLLAGAAVYGAAMLLLRAITKEDLATLMGAFKKA